MAWSLVLPIAMALLANVPNARACEPTIEPPGVPACSDPPVGIAPPETVPGWYGAPALIVDGAVAIGFAAFVHETDTDSQHGGATVLYGLTAAYLLAGPVVHLVHGHGARSAESLLVRAGALAAGVATTYALVPYSGCAVEVSQHAPCRAPYALVLSPLAAMLIDDWLLAREPVAQQPPSKTLSTRVLLQPGLALFGVGGTF